MTADNCKRIHETRSMDLGGKEGYIVGLKSNSTSSRSITLAGHAAADGRCSGTQYSDPYGTWDSVVVQATVKITLRDFEASIRRSSDEIVLPSGLHCKVATGTCLDMDGGETFWSTVPPDNCHFSHYDVLYEGKATEPPGKDVSKNQRERETPPLTTTKCPPQNLSTPEARHPSPTALVPNENTSGKPVQLCHVHGTYKTCPEISPGESQLSLS
ncbi:hypothetical protein G5I_13313 [Acromyrmex echinatior]|uniref:Uncharacterized protein n=1 Tax=Acromyrmex echinatior TaxID=103372 RepID=F4X4P4_ACREC|nr:hypothetical protein G5I_13313 [Acromyrmex echinatior]